MTTQDSTVANADLWARYFQDQWRAFLNPFGMPADSPVAQIAEGTAAQVANFVTIVAAGPIAWLYNTNAPQVTQIVGDERHARETAIDPAALDGQPAESVEDFAA